MLQTNSSAGRAEVISAISLAPLFTGAGSVSQKKRVPVLIALLCALSSPTHAGVREDLAGHTLITKNSYSLVLANGVPRSEDVRLHVYFSADNDIFYYDGPEEGGVIRRGEIYSKAIGEEEFGEGEYEEMSFEYWIAEQNSGIVLTSKHTHLPTGYYNTYRHQILIRGGNCSIVQYEQSSNVSSSFVWKGGECRIEKGHVPF